MVSPRPPGADAGQASVELVALLPLVAIFVVLLWAKLKGWG